MKAGAGLPMSGEIYWGMSRRRAAATSSPSWQPRRARFSAACLRYSQLAQPAQAKMARMKKNDEKNDGVALQGDETSSLLLYEDVARSESDLARGECSAVPERNGMSDLEADTIRNR